VVAPAISVPNRYFAPEKNAMTSKIYHPEDKHPEPYQQDLGPDASKGLNYGKEGADVSTRSAFDIKLMHGWLSEFSSDELRQLRVLNPGVRLETAATYLRIDEEERGEFSAQGTEDVLEGEIYIPKKETPYELWNRLIHKELPSKPR
jgi:hypothetical protein